MNSEYQNLILMFTQITNTVYMITTWGMNTIFLINFSKNKTKKVNLDTCKIWMHNFFMEL